MSSWRKVSSPQESNPTSVDQNQVSLADIMSEQYASFLLEQDVNGKAIASEDSDSCPVDHIDHLDESSPNLSSPDDEITTTDNDHLLAQLLQAEFDKEYNNHLERYFFNHLSKLTYSTATRLVDICYLQIV